MVWGLMMSRIVVDFRYARNGVRMEGNAARGRLGRHVAMSASELPTNRIRTPQKRARRFEVLHRGTATGSSAGAGGRKMFQMQGPMNRLHNLTFLLQGRSEAEPPLFCSRNKLRFQTAFASVSRSVRERFNRTSSSAAEPPVTAAEELREELSSRAASVSLLSFLQDFSGARYHPR
jgi:hypothetical protein